MLTEAVLFPVAAGALAFTGLKLRKQAKYRRLQSLQRTLVADYIPKLGLLDAIPEQLPDFQRCLAVVPHPVTDTTLAMLREAALRRGRSERSFVPAHKQGGTVAYEDLHAVAPEIVAFYQSDYLRRLCSAVIGVPVVTTPLHDQSSCSLLVYEKPRDHIGWHYDHNFYNGRHFTVLLPLVNRHLKEDRLSSAELRVRLDGTEQRLPTPPNTLILFEGARVFHGVSRLAADELRIMLSMTFCTDPRSTVFKGIIRRFKDTAYYGVRALWT